MLFIMSFVSPTVNGEWSFEICGRHGGLMVSALDSRLNGLGSSPGLGTVLCSWAAYFTLIVPLSTQVYKWVTGKFQYCWGVSTRRV